MNLEEDYEPDKAGPIVGLARSPHYFHSGYNDLIISGLVGIRPRADDTLEINPIAPADSLTYFRLQDVIYHGRTVAVQWDTDGSRYGQGAGLRVEVDDQVVATSSTLSRVTAPITSADAPAINRSQIAKSVQLQRGQTPSGSASSGTDAENLHDAIDGRVWFFAEVANGWNSDATSAASTQFYSIDFGGATSLTGCELAFYDDGDTFAVPTDYDILRYDNDAWVKIQGDGAFGDAALANGITRVSWPELSTTQLRVSFPQAAGKRTRLVEFKAF